MFTPSPAGIGMLTFGSAVGSGGSVSSVDGAGGCTGPVLIEVGSGIGATFGAAIGRGPGLTRGLAGLVDEVVVVEAVVGAVSACVFAVKTHKQTTTAIKVIRAMVGIVTRVGACGCATREEHRNRGRGIKRLRLAIRLFR